MEIYKEIDLSAPLTKEQLEMLEALKSRDVTPDEENPELTDEELHEMIRCRKEQNCKKTISLRLSPSALKKAKSLGKGYTSILSTILEQTLADNNKLKQFLS